MEKGSRATWSGPKMRSPRVPFSPMSMPLAICSTLVFAAATFPFTLSASWLWRLSFSKPIFVFVDELILKISQASPEKLVSFCSCLSNLRWQGCCQPEFFVSFRSWCRKLFSSIRYSLGQLTLLVVHQVHRGHQRKGDEQDRKY